MILFRSIVPLPSMRRVLFASAVETTGELRISSKSTKSFLYIVKCTEAPESKIQPCSCRSLHFSHFVCRHFSLFKLFTSDIISRSYSTTGFFVFSFEVLPDVVHWKVVSVCKLVCVEETCLSLRLPLPLSDNPAASAISSSTWLAQSIWMGPILRGPSSSDSSSDMSRTST